MATVGRLMLFNRLAWAPRNRNLIGKTASITGITGQDGSYLAELLLNKSYAVHGIKRRSGRFNTSRIDDLLPDWHKRKARLFLHFADLSVVTSLSDFCVAYNAKNPIT